VTVETDPRARARAYLAAIVDNPEAKPADRLRAAEAILRDDAPRGVGLQAARDMSDAELEAAARGEGGTPPERGPAAGVTETGPIRASRNDPRKNPLALQPTVARNVKGGPKKGPSGPESRPPAVADVDPLS
jgi:hypothetical protein